MNLLLGMDESGARNLDQTGQHYMIDKTLIEFIVSCADLDKNDVVLEIGYGKGALTKYLAKKCKVIAIDIEEYQLDLKNVTLVKGNILNLFESLFEKHRFNKVVANIPYNISEPLMKILFKYTELDSIVLTMGKNFADIITQTDNRLGIILNHLYDIEYLKTVNPRSFSPPPRVHSALIKLEPKSDNLSKLYSKLVVLEDKKLKNAFENIFSDKTKRQVKELTQHVLFEKRLYELNNREFLELDNILREL